MISYFENLPTINLPSRSIFIKRNRNVLRKQVKYSRTNALEKNSFNVRA